MLAACHRQADNGTTMATAAPLADRFVRFCPLLKDRPLQTLFTWLLHGPKGNLSIILSRQIPSGIKALIPLSDQGRTEDQNVVWGLLGGCCMFRRAIPKLAKSWSESYTHPADYISEGHGPFQIRVLVRGARVVFGHFNLSAARWARGIISPLLCTREAPVNQRLRVRLIFQS